MSTGPEHHDPQAPFERVVTTRDAYPVDAVRLLSGRTVRPSRSNDIAGRRRTRTPPAPVIRVGHGAVRRTFCKLRLDRQRSIFLSIAQSARGAIPLVPDLPIRQVSNRRVDATPPKIVTCGNAICPVQASNRPDGSHVQNASGRWQQTKGCACVRPGVTPPSQAMRTDRGYSSNNHMVGTCRKETAA